MTKAKTSPTLPSIQILRGIAALLVVIWHSDLALERFTNDYWRDGTEAMRAAFYPFWANHLCIGVDIFFCISGFIMTMLAAKATTRTDAWLFLRNRVVRIFPPYWFFTFLLLLLFAMDVPFHIWRLNGQLMHDVPDTLLSLILWPQKMGPVLAVGWTLVHEFFFYLFVFALILLKQGKRVPHFLGLAALIGVAFRLTDIKILNGYFLSDYYVEFFMGSLAFVFYQRASRSVPALQLTLAVLLYLHLSYSLDQTLGSPTFHLLNVFGSGLISFLLISGLHGLQTRFELTSSRLGRFAVRLGDASYSLYLSHWFSLSAIGLLAIPFADAPRSVIIAWHILSVSVAVGVGMLFAHWAELPFHRRLLKAFRKG